MDDVDVIGIHGNTILHRPSKGFSIQLGSAKMIAEKLKKSRLFATLEIRIYLWEEKVPH